MILYYELTNENSKFLIWKVSDFRFDRINFSLSIKDMYELSNLARGNSMIHFNTC